MTPFLVLRWLERVIEQALEEAAAGDPTMINRLRAVAAARHYYENVVRLNTMSSLQWSRRYPPHFATAQRLYAQFKDAPALDDYGDKAEQVRRLLEQARATVIALNQKVNELEARVTALEVRV